MFTQRLNSKRLEWLRVMEAGADIMFWWLFMVKAFINEWHLPQKWSEKSDFAEKSELMVQNGYSFEYL